MSESATNGARGRIFEIQRFSIHDGPGIRTTVFMKGCPLRCVWCHNPEGIDSGPLLSFQPEKCVACGYCFRICPQHAHQMKDGHHVLDRDLCELCGSCSKECWAKAIELVGRDISVEDVIAEVVRDKLFYETSGGGITLSGGEPMAQIEFAKALLVAARSKGIHCCVETCGLAPSSSFEEVMPHVDLFLFDIKDTNNECHIKLTGVSNIEILANVRMLHEQGARIRLRLPLIPGFNVREDHFSGIADLVRTLPNLCGVEIAPYHKLGKDKYQRLGLSSDANLPDASVDELTLRHWIDRLAALGVDIINAPYMKK